MIPELPFGFIVDPRDIRCEVDAKGVRVEVWTGREIGSNPQGGTCSTYEVDPTGLADVLAWRKAHPELEVNIGIVATINDEVALVKL